MKLRTDFVTNSSSSSYVILIKEEPVKCEHCGYKPPGLVETIQNPSLSRTLFQNHSGYDSAVEAVGKREVLEEIDDNIRYDGEGYWEGLRKTVKALSADANVVWVRIGYHEELVNHVFDTGLAKGDFEQLDPTT